MAQPSKLPTRRRAACAQRRGLALLAGLFVLGGSGEARAQCFPLYFSNVATENWQGGTGAGYEVFDPVDRVQAVTVRVVKWFGTCNYAIGITQGGSGMYSPRELSLSGAPLDYNLYDTASQTAILRDLPDGGPVITGSFNGPFIQATNHTFYWVIPAGQLLPGGAGQYQDQPTLRLYDQSGGGALRDSQGKVFQAQIPRVVELSLVDTGAPFNRSDLSQTLDFGIFFTGEQLAFDLRARGNAAFDVTMRSLNSGVMQHVSAASQLPYALTVSGSPIDLSGGADVNVASFAGPATGVQGEVYPVVVTVGSLAGTVSGVHRDSITVSLIAR